MSYRGQQRHELKVADARILMGRLRQKALRLLQSTKAWKEDTNNDTVRVLVAGGGGGGGGGDEEEESRFAVPFQNDDGMAQDQQIMQDMFGSNGNNNRRRDRRGDRRGDRRESRDPVPTHQRRRGRGRKGKRGGRRRKKHNNFLPALGGGLSVPELDIHDAGKRQQPRPYMSSSFDMARQPFMKSSPFDASPSPQMWEGKCCCVWYCGPLLCRCVMM